MVITSRISDIDPELLPALRSRRPILHHLNADTTWLLQLPIPNPSTGRKWYNIILDPWLTGPQSDVASWFSKQWHAENPALGSIEQVDELCEIVERLSSSSSSSASSTIEETTEKRPRGQVDAIAISHEFTDHCHKETLVQFDPSVPVIATAKAKNLVASWNHFERVIETPSLEGSGANWDSVKIPGLPSWVGIGRIVNGKDALYYHSAISVIFQLEPSGPIESVIYSPHGISPTSLSPVFESEPKIETLAILHGLHDVSIDWGQQLNLGALNGVKVQRALDSRYWIGTHDEIKEGGGLVSWLLRRKVYSISDVLNQAEANEGGSVLGRGEYLELGNGAVAVLV